MGPPPAAGEEKIVVLKAVGGEIGSASSLAPKLGPLGLVRSHHFDCFFFDFCLQLVTQEGWRRYPKGYYGLEGN
jgi:hypothetical protein